MLTEEQEKMFHAIINQDLDKLKELFSIYQGKDYSFTDENGNTLLHYASDHRSDKTLPIVQLLLRNGCEPQAVNANFETPLDRAKTNNNVPAMTVIKHYINLKNQEDKNYL